MSEYKLAAENRADAGKGAARRLRAAGRVPAVLYGHGTKPRSLSVDAREFGHALRTDAGTNVLLELEVGRTRHLALAKEIQRLSSRSIRFSSIMVTLAGVSSACSGARSAVTVISVAGSASIISSPLKRQTVVTEDARPLARSDPRPTAGPGRRNGRRTEASV